MKLVKLSYLFTKNFPYIAISLHFVPLTPFDAVCVGVVKGFVLNSLWRHCLGSGLCPGILEILLCSLRWLWSMSSSGNTILTAKTSELQVIATHSVASGLKGMLSYYYISSKDVLYKQWYIKSISKEFSLLKINCSIFLVLNWMGLNTVWKTIIIYFLRFIYQNLFIELL